ncbi:hypothetical protein ACFLQN_03945 [Candidatus Aenigmatarchaeota archaeon]
MAHWKEEMGLLGNRQIDRSQYPQAHAIGQRSQPVAGDYGTRGREAPRRRKHRLSDYTPPVDDVVAGLTDAGSFDIVIKVDQIETSKETPAARGRITDGTDIGYRFRFPLNPETRNGIAPGNYATLSITKLSEKTPVWDVKATRSQ